MNHRADMPDRDVPRVVADRPAPARSRAAAAWSTSRLLVKVLGWGLLLGIVALTWGTRVLPYKTDVIIGRSMEPTIPLWSVTIVEAVPVRALRTGDVIAFDRPGAPGERVTHRVTRVRADEDGTPTFATRGDNNDAVDPWTVRYAGDTAFRIRTHVPAIGWLLWQAQQPHSRILLVILPVLYLLAHALRHIWRPRPQVVSEHRHTDDDAGNARPPERLAA